MISNDYVVPVRFVRVCALGENYRKCQTDLCIKNGILRYISKQRLNGIIIFSLLLFLFFPCVVCYWWCDLMFLQLYLYFLRKRKISFFIRMGRERNWPNKPSSIIHKQRIMIICSSKSYCDEFTHKVLRG